SVVKSLAPVTLGTVLIAISPASLSASDAQDLAFAYADMPIKQLKDVYLDCERGGRRCAGALRICWLLTISWSTL
ncbi:hypothetical protein, partial [Mesorhizobium sp. M0955]